MKLSSRLIRQVIIAVVFLAVFTLFGYGTRQLTQSPPSCMDGVMNGEEEGIDCGLFACGKYCEPDLAPPKVLSTKLIEASRGDYDFVAEIENPHPNFGASEVVYELTLWGKDQDELLLKKEGVFYILPAQKKYLILPFLTTKGDITIVGIKFEIKSAKWQKIESLEGMNLVVRQEKYTVLPDRNSSFLEAIIFNDSDFDFEIVDVDVVLRSSKGAVVAVNRSEIRTFIARTERHFKVTWPFTIDDRVAKVEIKPSTNLFENSNFIKSYGSEVEKFQNY